MLPVLKLTDISFSYNTVPVLKNISMSFYPGEIHSLVGENGTGKTTLVNIICGLLKPDNGILEVNGSPWSSLSFQTALKLKIAIVPQDLILPESVHLFEYIFLGREPVYKHLVDYRKMLMETNKLMDNLQLNMDPEVKVGSLNMAEKRMLAIARAVSLQPKILIFDEATNFFSSAESEKFNRLLRILKQQGISVIHITHKLDEVMRISDRISILRESGLRHSALTNTLTRDEVISLMVGKDHSHAYYWIPHYPSGNEILRVENLSLGKRLTDISLTLMEGEVIGLAGLVGSGRTTLGRILYGLEHPDRGDIFIKGEKKRIVKPSDAMSLGIGYISDDRHRYGILEHQSLAYNLTLNVLKKLKKLFFIIRKKEKAVISDSMEKYDLRKYSPDAGVDTLSGGTQQKVAFARCTGEMPEILIVDEPVKEIDITGQKEIFSIINNLAGNKVGVILISSVLGDLINNCDRILILKEGRLVKEMRKTEFNEEMIMHYAIDSRVSDETGDTL